MKVHDRHLSCLIMHSCVKFLVFAFDGKHIVFYQTRSVDMVRSGKQQPSMLALCSETICPWTAHVHEIYITPSETTQCNWILSQYEQDSPRNAPSL